LGNDLTLRSVVFPDTLGVDRVDSGKGECLWEVYSVMKEVDDMLPQRTVGGLVDQEGKLSISQELQRIFGPTVGRVVVPSERRKE